jgi:hypothetical protein
MGGSDKSAAMAMIARINEVEGFDPASLAVEYIDMNTGETHRRLPVMAQVAWFRLKYPEGRHALSVAPGKDCFVATARVYKHHMDPPDCFLAEATASRGAHPAKPSVSPREWAQTAALGIALRNAGFGLQFQAAGEGFDEPAANEMSQSASPAHEPLTGAAGAAGASQAQGPSAPEQRETAPPEPPAEDPLETAMKMPCPLGKYRGKTLGDLILIEPKALVWVANKFSGDSEISMAAKLICEHSLQTA